MHFKDARHLLHGLFGLRYARGCTLRAVHGRTTAEAHEGFAVVFQVQAANLLDVVDGGVRDGLVVEHRLHAGFLASLEGVVAQPEFADDLVGDDDDGVDALVDAEFRYVLGAVQNLGFAVRHDGNCSSECGLIRAAPDFVQGIHGGSLSLGFLTWWVVI